MGTFAKICIAVTLRRTLAYATSGQFPEELSDKPLLCKETQLGDETFLLQRSRALEFGSARSKVAGAKVLSHLDVTLRSHLVEKPGYIGRPAKSLSVREMTIEQAKQEAMSIDGCQGFSFQGVDDGHPHQIYFMNGDIVKAKAGWTSYVMQSDAAVAVEPHIAMQPDMAPFGQQPDMAPLGQQPDMTQLLARLDAADPAFKNVVVLTSKYRIVVPDPEFKNVLVREVNEEHQTAMDAWGTHRVPWMFIDDDAEHQPMTENQMKGYFHRHYLEVLQNLPVQVEKVIIEDCNLVLGSQSALAGEDMQYALERFRPTGNFKILTCSAESVVRRGTKIGNDVMQMSDIIRNNGPITVKEEGIISFAVSCNTHKALFNFLGKDPWDVYPKCKEKK